MIFESKFGKVNIEHVQKNADGMYHYLSVLDAIKVQAYELYKFIDIENKAWITKSDVNALVKLPERIAEKKAKETRIKQEQALEIESRRLFVCFSSTFLGTLYETGISSEVAVKEEVTFGSLLGLLEREINSNTLSVRDKDYISVCRYRLLTAKKNKNELVYLANSKGVKNAV